MLVILAIILALVYDLAVSFVFQLFPVFSNQTMIYKLIKTLIKMVDKKSG